MPNNHEEGSRGWNGMVEVGEVIEWTFKDTRTRAFWSFETAG